MDIGAGLADSCLGATSMVYHQVQYHSDVTTSEHTYEYMSQELDSYYVIITAIMADNIH